MIIYFETSQIQLMDIPRVLGHLGYTVQCVDLQIKAQGFSRETCDRIVETLMQEEPECAVSYDFSETISQACLEADIPYIAWVYDDPQQELYTRYAHNPNNYIFVFDRLQRERLKRIGLRNVYHMPLAVHGDKVVQALQQGNQYAGQYEAEIAFVGQLYRIESLERIMNQAAPKVQAAMEKSIADCFLQWNNRTKMHGTMTPPCVQYFSDVDGHKVERDYPFASEQFYYEAAVLSRILANRERIAILNELAEHYDVRFYTFDRDVRGVSPKVQVCPGAKYDMEVSNVYSQSKINLNITLHCIETGISQRVFDVMAAGGFLLTNYQEELEELFVPGEDLVIYHNMEELQYYVAYYLEHEEERQRIAGNGQRKVLKDHDFHIRLEQVLKQVREKEQGRTERYRDILRRNEAEIEMMQELSLCGNVENKLKMSKVFRGIGTMEDAVEKYFDVRELLIGISVESEAVLYENICRLIREKEIPAIYIIWYLYVKKDDRESLLLKLCENMKKYSIAGAIELVSYALLMTPHATALLLKKAECFMEISMWSEALDTLRQIREPQEDIRVLIQELENAIRT